MNPGDEDLPRTPGAEHETDRAIELLAGQELDTSPDFVARVRMKIHRRTATAHVASFSWQLPKLILTEMVNVLTHLVSAVGGRRESQR